jgi:hypothetical protein
MALKIVCSGFLVRHPVGGHSWHHLQYLVGFRQLGHDVVYYEDHGWPNSCYNPQLDLMSADPAFGLTYTENLFRAYELRDRWCYLAEDGAVHGMARERLADSCRECDLYVNLSNMNWIEEASLCRRRVMVDTDPVFTQIGAHGAGGPFSRYHALFTYGENVHRPGCEMPDGGARWLPTRQPVVLDAWPVEPGRPSAPFTSVMNWSAYGASTHRGRFYGQKDREFEPFFALPRETGRPMALAVTPPGDVKQRLTAGGWRLDNPREVSRDPWTYQRYLRGSRAEFCVAKHGYVSTRCGWFSDRSAGYLASGRPVVVQDTGFSDFLPTGSGLLSYRNPSEAAAAVRRVSDDYESHCQAARALCEEFFDARRVLGRLLEQSL